MTTNKVSTDVVRGIIEQNGATTLDRLTRHLNLQRRAIRSHLQALETEGVLLSAEGETRRTWTIAPDQTAGADPLTAEVELGEGMIVRIQNNDNDAELLIQAGPDGYQLDARWNEGDDDWRSSSVWANFNDDHQAATDYSYDNRHDRLPALVGDNGTLHIFDPDPRASNMGYDGAELRVEPADNGFRVELQWTDENGKVHVNKTVVPFIDPRHDRQGFFQHLENVS